MKVNNVVICAAGIGSRLGFDMPKCMVPLGEHRLIYYLLKALDSIENIWMVVGFKEDEVISYVKSIRKDVIFVRNPEYRTTSNSFSLYLGSHIIKEPFLNVDGDMILDKTSFMEFVDSINPGEDVIAYTDAKTEDAVFVELNDHDEVTKFSREPISSWEWSGVACFSNIEMDKDGKYVYQVLEKDLPIAGRYLKCFEIDTPEDLHLLRRNIKDIDYEF